jgi:hypothetical protein
MDTIRALALRKVEEEWDQWERNAMGATRREIADLKWHIQNLEGRMVGFTDEENRELAQRVEEYREQIRILVEQPPAVTLPVFTVCEVAGEERRQAWVRDADGLRPVDPAVLPEVLPMPWLCFEIVDERHVMLDWMYGPLAGAGELCRVEGKGDAIRLVSEGTTWVS